MSLKEFFNNNPDKRYIMFGGKGGLGKTTFSAATGFHLAKQGKKVLVFSVDPQASLSDIFQRDLFGKGATEIMPNLYTQEVDADKRIHEYQDEIRNKIRSRYGLEAIPEEIEDYIKAASAEPAMEESAIFDAVVDIVMKGEYDYYIYDLVPLGHALYYLAMASIYDAWIEKITNLRQEMRQYDRVISKMRDKKLEEDEILEELHYIKNRINAAANIFTDKEKSAFFFVVVPEEMVITDTNKAYELFSKFKVPITGSIVNRMLPKDLLNESHVPDYLKHRIAAQEKPLKEIKKTFGQNVLGYIQEFERDITGLEMIEKVARELFK